MVPNGFCLVVLRLGLLFLAVWLVGSSAFAAEVISFEGTTKWRTDDFVTLTAKMTKPQGEGPFPAVVLMHDCYGISRFNDAWANRFASWGYVAFQVDSLGPRGESDICADNRRVPSLVRARDAYDAKAYLARLPFVDRDRIALIGWSHGGVATLIAVSSSNYAAFAGNVNTVSGAARPAMSNATLKPKDPFRAAVAFYPYCRGDLADSNAPLLILAGALDDWSPADLCRKRMPSGKTEHEVALKIYPGSYHGFDMVGMDVVKQQHRLCYNPEAFSDSVVRVKEFLAKYLK